MAVDPKLHWSINFDHLVLGRKVELQSFGYIILDHESGFTNGCCPGVDKGPRPPGPAWDSGVERNRERMAARTLICQNGAAEFDAVRTFHDQRERRPDRGIALAVAQQR